VDAVNLVLAAGFTMCRLIAWAGIIRTTRPGAAVIVLLVWGRSQKAAGYKHYETK
jgi:hypothetical protein